MKTSIATVSISGTLSEKLAAVAASGFDGRGEIFENDFLTFDGSPAESAAWVGDHGLEVTLFQPSAISKVCRNRTGRVLSTGRAQVRRDAGAWNGTDAGLFQRFPAGIGRHRPPLPTTFGTGARGRQARLARRLRGACWGRHRQRSSGCLEIVRRADHPNIGLILDSFHTLSRNIDLRSIRSIPGDRIFIVSARDAPQSNGSALSQPPFPQHARRRRSSGRRFHAGCRRDRLWTAP